MKIEFYSPTIRRKEMDAVLTSLVEDKIGPGDQTKLFIQIAREKIKFDYCIALRSPAIALYEALSSLNIEDGGGVIISALSPVYYYRVIKELRLTPVYADVMQGSAFITKQSVENAIASKPAGCDVKAIVLHHTLGVIPDVPSICELGIPVIEDCSESFGSVAAGEAEAGSRGAMTILGLEEQDMLTAGGGALLYTMNRKDSSLIKNRAAEAGELPPEYGLPDMNASMGIVQLREAARNIEKRRIIADAYAQSTLKTRHKRIIQSDFTAEYNNFAFPLILETGMKDVKSYAKRKDIALESAFERTLISNGLVRPEECPDAYSLSLRTVLFPLYPRLTASETERVCKLITSLP